MASAGLGILFDLDGVIYQADSPIAGAREALQCCKAREIPFRFVTNTTSRPRAAIIKKLSGMGIEADCADLLTPAVAAATDLGGAGQTASLFVPEATREEFSGLEATPGQIPDAVVVGDLGESWTFARLNRAFVQLMQDDKVRLIALGMTRYWRARDGLRLDTGPFVKALEYAVGRSAEVVGKPAADFFLAGCRQLALDPGNCIMIGDDIRSDVGAAQAAGLQGILVRTGKFQASDLGQDIKPDAVLDSIADLPQWLEQRPE